MPLVTQNDIAKAAGVSRLSVHRALTGQKGVSQATRRRIQKLADKFGYRPNAFARGMRTGTFGTVALILSKHAERSYLPFQALAGICDALDQDGLQLTVARLPDEKLTDASFLPRICRELCSDGMLIDYTNDTPNKLDRLVESLRQPAIWLNRKRAHDCVYPDDVALGREATRRLLAVGHRRIVYFDWGPGWKQLDHVHYSRRDRQVGYAEAMRDAGLTPRPIRRDDSDVPTSSQEIMAVIGELVRGENAATGFVSYAWRFGRHVAAGVQRQGLRVPADVSMITIGEQLHRTDDNTWVDTAVVPSYGYGVAAVEAVLDKIKSPETLLPARAVEPAEFRSGQTVAPPPGVSRSQAVHDGKWIPTQTGTRGRVTLDEGWIADKVGV
ncbi:MAG: LacI family DNA-binding transcriptional regulator [Phycisphaerae bacterium]|nr:LacI family DNA-binding transcriptional regulator [Phycisphaerae bacterium]